MNDFCSHLVDLAQSTDLSTDTHQIQAVSDQGMSSDALAAVMGSGTLSDPGPDPLPDPDPFPNDPDTF